MLWIFALLLIPYADGSERCFKKYENRYFAGSAKSALSNVTVTDCLSKCLLEKKFLCKSVTYLDGLKECFLNNRDKKQDPRNYIVIYNTDKSVYYQRKCYNKEKRVKAFAAIEVNKCFNRIPGKVLIGVVDQLIQDVTSEQKCQKLCEKQGKDSNFICKAVMYYPEEQECILTSQNRHEMPDLFIADPKAIYMENRCIASVVEDSDDAALADEYNDLLDSTNESNDALTLSSAGNLSKLTNGNIPKSTTPSPSRASIFENLVEEPAEDAKTVAVLPDKLPLDDPAYDGYIPTPRAPGKPCCSGRLPPPPPPPLGPPIPPPPPPSLPYRRPPIVLPPRRSCCGPQMGCGMNPGYRVCPPAMPPPSYSVPPPVYTRPYANSYALPRMPPQSNFVHESNNYAVLEPSGYTAPQGRPPILEPIPNRPRDPPGYAVGDPAFDEYEGAHVRNFIPHQSDSYKAMRKQKLAGIVTHMSNGTIQKFVDKICFLKSNSSDFKEDRILKSSTLKQCQQLCWTCDKCLHKNHRCVAIVYSVENQQCRMSSQLPQPVKPLDSKNSTVRYYKREDNC